MLVAVLVIFALIGGAVYFFFFRTRRDRETPPPSGGELRVHVLDVGQGDAILVLTPSNKAVLVDAGTPRSTQAVLNALNRYNVQQIDLFIATHAHADHIGGADNVLNAIPTRVILDSRVPHTTQTYRSFREAAERAVRERGAQYTTASPGQRFDLGDGAVVTILGPVEPYFTAQDLRAGGNEPNANSIIARLDYGDFSILLTGDAEMQTEQRLINTTGTNLRASVLKVGHHGSRYATSEDFLRIGRFRDAIISNGADNRYGHPNQEVLDRLRGAGVNVYRTDLQGEITIRTTGSGYQISTEREAPANELWTGRRAERDDSARSGFVQYGEFGPRNANRSGGRSSRRAANSGR